jgi:hypothetical protein
VIIAMTARFNMRSTDRAAEVAMDLLGEPNCVQQARITPQRLAGVLTSGRSGNVTLGESWLASPTAIARVEPNTS